MTNAEQQAYDEDYEDFLQEIEGDRELRSRINLYKKDDIKKNKEHYQQQPQQQVNKDYNELDEEEVRLDELLDDMSLDDQDNDDYDVIAEEELGLYYYITFMHISYR